MTFHTFQRTHLDVGYNHAHDRAVNAVGQVGFLLEYLEFVAALILPFALDVAEPISWRKSL